MSDKITEENMEVLGVKKKLSSNLIFACLGPYLGALSFGYFIGYSSPAVPSMIKDSVMTTEAGYTFGSLGTLGGAVGCPLAGWFLERCGRKRTILVSALPFLVGWILIGSGTMNMMYLGRILTGAGSGMIMVVGGVYIAETAPKEMRGMLGSGVQLWITIGILLVYALGLFLDWKSLAYIGALIPVLATLVAFRIPDTPRFHLLKGDRQGATRALAWLSESNDVDDEIRDIEESLPDPSDKVSWSDFLKPQLLRPLQVSLGLMVLQQLTGINIVMFYTVSIFESAGFKENGQFATVIVGLAQVVSTVLACILMDKAGRRKLLAIAGIGMGLSCFTMAYCFLDTDSSGSLSLLSLVLYIVAFALGWGPIPMLIMSEVFPVKTRGPATSMASITSWGSSFVVTSSYGLLLSLFGQSGAFALFGICCILSVVFVARMVPETKGKSLEDIELYFLGRTLRGGK